MRRHYIGLDLRAAELCSLSYGSAQKFIDIGMENVVHLHGPENGADVFVMESDHCNWVVFRGTQVTEDSFSWRDVLTDLKIARKKIPGNDFNLHSGFYEAYREIAGVLTEEIGTLASTQQYQDGETKPTIYTGHSLGAAMAAIAAGSHRPQQLITFGGPRFGGKAIAERHAETEYHRWVNSADWCPRVPFGFGYRHGGDCYFVNDASDLIINPPYKTLFIEFFKHFFTKWQRHGVKEYIEQVRIVNWIDNRRDD